MLEKNGLPQLTEEDLRLFYSGVVSDRVKETWGFSLDVLRDVVTSGNYTKIIKGTSIGKSTYVKL